MLLLPTQHSLVLSLKALNQDKVSCHKTETNQWDISDTLIEMREINQTQGRVVSENCQILA